jgi:hypothetical protein
VAGLADEPAEQVGPELHFIRLVSDVVPRVKRTSKAGQP